MLIRALYIFILNLLTYGGGGVYIPVYEHYYTQVFHLMSQNDYYNVVSILNIIPGVTGGKLAGYAMFLEFGYLFGFCKYENYVGKEDALGKGEEV